MKTPSNLLISWIIIEKILLTDYLLQLSEMKRKDLKHMGNFGKKILGAGALGAAAGAAVYYFVKKKNEDPDLQEEFADFQDNVKETAASAVNVASRLKDAVEKSVDNAVNKVKEHTDDFIDDDIFEDEDSFSSTVSDVAEEVKETGEEAVAKAAQTVEKAAEKVKETAENVEEAVQKDTES